jgi:CarboxypepD_reg-like domain
MKFSAFLSLLVLLLSLPSCGNLKNDVVEDENESTSSNPINIIESSTAKSDELDCRISGQIIDENKEPVVGVAIRIKDTSSGAYTNENGKFEINQVQPGAYTLIISNVGYEETTLDVQLKAGDHFSFIGQISSVRMELLKPIIYIYPEETTEVEVSLNYDGKITTTYPKLPSQGWKVTAYPDGTLIDENEKEYYALYWEGEPRKPLRMEDGFVVSKDQTIPFLEEKLAQLGLKAKESNEFIIFWLPVLEKNAFNLIRFAGDDYLEQAQLNISPTPETIIRVTMVFQGLDEEIEFPIQDLS